ncbi:hypothetical protein ACFL5V_05370 [Fibrobacterota bacterium]
MRILFYFLIFCSLGYSRLYFRDYGDISTGRPVELLFLTRVGKTAATDSSGYCGEAEAAFSKVSIKACREEVLHQSGNQDHRYIYWVFLNLVPEVGAEKLRPRFESDRQFTGNLKNPVLVIQRNGGKNRYVLFLPEREGPVAGGETDHEGLGDAMEGIQSDLLSLESAIMNEKAGKRKHQVLDASIGLGALSILMLSSDKESNEDSQNSDEIKIDLEDFIESEGIPLVVRTGLIYKKTVGLRFSWKHSYWSMLGDSLAGIGVFDKWNIIRNDFTGDILAGKSFSGARDAEAFFFVFAGTGGTFYRENVRLENGQREKGELFLKDALHLSFGLGTSIRLSRFFSLSTEMGFLGKQFDAVIPTNPDGSGSEVFVQLTLGGCYRLILK